MINSEKLANTVVSLFIEKNLLDNTTFQNTSEFISYMVYKESQNKSNSNSKQFE